MCGTVSRLLGAVRPVGVTCWGAAWNRRAGGRIGKAVLLLEGQKVAGGWRQSSLGAISKDDTTSGLKIVKRQKAFEEKKGPTRKL